jgi:hypothetical protein
MYVFLIDIPFKEPLEYEVQSYSGVNDTAVHVTAVSMTPQCISQWCQWHRCATNLVDLFRKYEAIFKKALTRVSGA